MAEPNKRTIRLTGLGESIDDRIKDLLDLKLLTRSEEEKAEIEKLAGYLEDTKEVCRAFCRTWSREFDV